MTAAMPTTMLVCFAHRVGGRLDRSASIPGIQVGNANTLHLREGDVHLGSTSFPLAAIPLHPAGKYHEPATFAARGVCKEPVGGAGRPAHICAGPA